MSFECSAVDDVLEMGVEGLMPSSTVLIAPRRTISAASDAADCAGAAASRRYGALFSFEYPARVGRRDLTHGPQAVEAVAYSVGTNGTAHQPSNATAVPTPIHSRQSGKRARAEGSWGVESWDRHE